MQKFSDWLSTHDTTLYELNWRQFGKGLATGAVMGGALAGASLINNKAPDSKVPDKMIQSIESPHLVATTSVDVVKPPIKTAEPDYANFTAHWEGYRDLAYKDKKGLETIGYGTLIDARTSAGRENMNRLSKIGYNYNALISRKQAVSKDDALILLKIKINEALITAPTLISNFNKQPSQVRLIIVDLIYNLGVDGFSKFHDTRKAIVSHNYSLAADCLQDSLWASQVGRRAADHINTLRKRK